MCRAGASISDDPDIGVLDVGWVHETVCSPRGASRARWPAERTSSISRHLAGLGGVLSKPYITRAWIVSLVLPTSTAGRTSAVEMQQQHHTRLPNLRRT